MSAKKRVAINGFGRIGRAFFRNYCERVARGKDLPFEVVAINDREDPVILRHLLQYDSSYGQADLEALECLEAVQFTRFGTPNESQWGRGSIDYLLECSGSYRQREALEQHLQAGAKKVLLGAPAFDELDRMVVYGVNHDQLYSGDCLVSNASCTTNALAITLTALMADYSIEQLWVTEIHGYTSDQNLLDHAHRDPRRARSAAHNMIPTQTKGLDVIDRILPDLTGRVTGYSMRVPLPLGACLDMTLRLGGGVTPTVAEINRLFKDREGALLGYCDQPLVSGDFIGRSESAVFDATQTRVMGDSIKIAVWFDNEWGYSNRLLDLFCYWMALDA